MVNSYEDMMGSEMNPMDHPAHDIPDATQHYAGDVIPLAGEKSMGSGETPNAVPYALGTKKDPKVLSIGAPAIKSWYERRR